MQLPFSISGLDKWRSRYHGHRQTPRESCVAPVLQNFVAISSIGAPRSRQANRSIGAGQEFSPCRLFPLLQDTARDRVVRSC
jgi:hypothetical protein